MIWLLEFSFELILGDYSRLLKQQQNQNDISLQLSKLYALMGELDSAISAIKECLHNDPDEKECKGYFRLLKKYQKGFSSLQKSSEKKKWVSILDTLFKEQFLDNCTRDLESPTLTKKAQLLACSAYGGVMLFDLIFLDKATSKGNRIL